MQHIELTDCDTFYCPASGELLFQDGECTFNVTAAEFVYYHDDELQHAAKSEYYDWFSDCENKAEQLSENEADENCPSAYSLFLDRFKDNKNLILISFSDFDIDYCINMAYKGE